MKNLAKVGILVGLLSLVIGCGSGPGARTLQLAKLNGMEYALLEPGTLNTSATTISGSGTIIVRHPRPDEDSNYALSFLLQPGGELTLVTNADNNLNSGIQLTFSRKSNDDLGIVLNDGLSSQDISEALPGQKADGVITLDVDVHAHGHMILFKDAIEEPLEFSARPKNLLWGLKLKNATVSSLVAGNAKEEH